MLNRTCRITLCIAATSFAVLPPSRAAAEPSCIAVGDRTNRAELERFKQAPGGFLADIASDQDKISGLVSSLVASDPGLLDAVKQLVATSGTAQRRAIGMGLASAALRCAATRPAAALAISDYVRKADSNVSIGFLSQSDPRRAVFPSASRARTTRGGDLMEGEFGDLIKDPFAAPELP